MKRYEFISVKEFPEGPYPTAIATVRVTSKDDQGYPVRDVLRYARKELKTGGTFWAMATHSYMLNGEKKYMKGYNPDSDIDEEYLIDFIKENVKRLANPVQMSGQVHRYPHGMGQTQQTQQTHQDEMPPMPPMPEQAPLPF